MSNNLKASVEKAVAPRLRFSEFQCAQAWQIIALGEITRIVRGGSPRPIDNYLTKEKDGLNWLKIGDVNRESKYIEYTEEKVIQKALSKTRVVHPFDLIMSNSMSFGRPYILKIKACIHDGWIAITDVSKNVCLEYLYYFILSSSSQTYFLKSAAGSGVKNLNIEIIKLLNIALPKLQEQQEIADCLSSIDELITAESKKLDALKTYKKGLMQQLFPAEGETLPKLRFPEFKNSENWEKIRIIDLASKEVKWSFTGGPFGSNLKSSDYTNTGIRVIQLQNIGDGEFIDNYKIYTSENKANELLSCNIYPGEIILSKMGDPVARACLIPDKEKRYVMCSDGIRLAVDKNKFDSYFIYSFINSETFRAIAEKSSTGSTRKRIGLDILKNLKIMVPTTQEQQKIAGILYWLDNFTINQSKKIETLKFQKKGLMQQLFPSDEDMMG